MNAIQYALPGLMGDATKQHNMAERCPITAEELRTVPDGVRLARFVDDAECAEHCTFGPFDHTVGWKYHTKVCLKDLARLGLWKPEDEHWYRLQKKREEQPHESVLVPEPADTAHLSHPAQADTHMGRAKRRFC